MTSPVSGASGNFVYDGAVGPLPPLSATAYVYDAVPEQVPLSSAPLAMYAPSLQSADTGRHGATLVPAAGAWGTKERDAVGLDYFGARYFSGAQGRFTSPDPLLNAGRPDNPQTWNKYAYTLNNPLKYTDPTGLYEWSQKCGDDDAQCQANRQQFRDALATIRNAANQYEEGSDERNKLEAVLDKYGDEGEKNKVSIKFGEAGGFPAQESTSLFGKKTITFDMKMLGDSFRNSNSINPDYKPSIGWGEVVAHEGAHMLDRFAFGNPVNRTGALRTETNAFDTQSFVPKATNQYSFWGLWNPSWVAADKETLRQNAVKDQAQKDVDLNWGKKK